MNYQVLVWERVLAEARNGYKAIVWLSSVIIVASLGLFTNYILNRLDDTVTFKTFESYRIEADRDRDLIRATVVSQLEEAKQQRIEMREGIKRLEQAIQRLNENLDKLAKING